MNWRLVAVALGATGQVPQQPSIDGAEEQVTSLGTLASALDVIEDPLDLRACRVGVDDQAGAATPLVRALLPRQLLADLGRTSVLPNNCVVDRFTSVFIPHDGGLALVGDAQRND